MEIKELICIGCPLGCNLIVRRKEDGEIEVTGNSCANGEKYAKKELTNPRRMVTSTVRVEGGTLPCVSVKTKTDIPKDKIMDCIRELKDIVIKPPIQIGDIVVKNIAATGVDVVATKYATFCMVK